VCVCVLSWRARVGQTSTRVAAWRTSLPALVRLLTLQLSCESAWSSAGMVGLGCVASLGQCGWENQLPRLSSAFAGKPCRALTAMTVRRFGTDVVPLLRKIQSDPRFRPAMKDMFGQALLCKDKDVATEVCVWGGV
jgi:hypothetical protein